MSSTITGKNVMSSIIFYLRYFPANFVTTEALETRGDTPTEPPEVIGAPPQKTSAGGDSSEQTCVALFDYVSDEPGDLSFQAGETIIIVKKVSNAIDHLFKLKTDQTKLFLIMIEIFFLNLIGRRLVDRKNWRQNGCFSIHLT